MVRWFDLLQNALARKAQEKSMPFPILDIVLESGEQGNRGLAGGLLEHQAVAKGHALESGVNFPACRFAQFWYMECLLVRA